MIKSKYADRRKAAEYVMMAHGHELLGRSLSESFYATISETVRRFLADECSPTGKFLDVGCGVGRTASDLAKVLPGSRVYGIDPSNEMVYWARTVVSDANPFTFKGKEYKGMGLPNVVFVVGYLEDLLHAPGQKGFDGITCINVLDRAGDPGLLLDQMVGLMRPKGVLLLANAFDYEELTAPEKRLSAQQTDGRLQVHGMHNITAFKSVLRKDVTGIVKEYDELISVYQGS